jgi:hypothetical protein
MASLPIDFVIDARWISHLRDDSDAVVVDGQKMR